MILNRKNTLNTNLGEKDIEVIYCRNKSKVSMETCGYDNLSGKEQKDTPNPNLAERDIEVIWSRNKAKVSMETCGYDNRSVKRQKRTLNKDIEDIYCRNKAKVSMETHGYDNRSVKRQKRTLNKDIEDIYCRNKAKVSMETCGYDNRSVKRQKRTLNKDIEDIYCRNKAKVSMETCGYDNRSVKRQKRTLNKDIEDIYCRNKAKVSMETHGYDNRSVKRQKRTLNKDIEDIYCRNKAKVSMETHGYDNRSVKRQKRTLNKDIEDIYCRNKAKVSMETHGYDNRSVKRQKRTLNKDIEDIYCRNKAKVSMETHGYDNRSVKRQKRTLNKDIEDIYCRNKAKVSMETHGYDNRSVKRQKRTLNKDIEDIYCRNKSKVSMETSGYDNLSVKEKENLNSIFQEIVTKAGIDFNNPEIQDIQSAISEMLERIKTWINQRGIFNISRTELCGSMAEETAMWKLSEDEQPFIELDFLAVLQAACDIKPGCQECFYVNTPPMNLDVLEKYYRSIYNSYLKDEHERKYIVEECFTRETNNCLASCGCQEVKYPNQNSWSIYTFKPSSTCSKTQQGCEKCTVDRPTGTLRVKTSVEMGTRRDCTLIFKWTSKAKTLCTRDRWCLPETEKMDNLTIHIDFLPALELLQSEQQSAGVAACSSSGLVLNPTSSEYEHYCFLVPKRCVLCDPDRNKGTWRRSGCRAEIDTIVNKMSDKHRKCYQVLKHLTGLTPTWYFFNNYPLKVAVLHHNSSCADAAEDCAECVFKVLDELQHAYETRQLKSLHSQANLLEEYGSFFCINYINYPTIISELKGAICSAVSESDSVSSFLEKVGVFHWCIT